MFKSKKTLGLVAAALVTGSACVSGPRFRPPPPADCPPGHKETVKRFNLYTGHISALRLLPYPDFTHNDWVPVSQGPMRFKLLRPWADLPRGSIVIGESFIGKERVYGRFTQIQLPGGETLPVCMELADYRTRGGKRGAPMGPGSTPENPTMWNIHDVEVVDRFH